MYKQIIAKKKVEMAAKQRALCFVDEIAETANCNYSETYRIFRSIRNRRKVKPGKTVINYWLKRAWV